MEVDMSKRKIEEIATNLAEPVVKKNSFELVDVEFVKEGPNWYLRIYIDKPGGITIDDCKVVSEEVSDLLDKEDPIPQSYFLEVSSPGLERPLKKDSDFEKFKGELVEVRLFKAINGKKIYAGELIGLIDNKIVISQDSMETIEFEREKVSLVRRTIIF
jgi:ribosome maturation factor RimP